VTPTISGKLGPDNAGCWGQFLFISTVMKSPIIKHSIVIARRRTSISLEDEFWKSLREIAKERNETLRDLVSKIDADRQLFNLSSAIRLFVLDYYRNRPGPGEGSA
jgi:predicted DNA-binding ribbon-helix-helix protein